MTPRSKAGDRHRLDGRFHIWYALWILHSFLDDHAQPRHAWRKSIRHHRLAALLTLLLESPQVVNGISAPLRASLAESTDETNQAEAFALYGMIWSIGAIVGNFIGGSLSGKWEGVGPVIDWLTGRWPYALPCLATGSIAFGGVVVTLLVYEEASLECGD